MAAQLQVQKKRGQEEGEANTKKATINGWMYTAWICIE